MQRVKGIKGGHLASDNPTESALILGMRVDGTDYGAAAERVQVWAGAGLSKYVCIATVNNVMEAHDAAEYKRIMNEADMVTPDGMPLVWGLKLLGHKNATRVYGPDLTPILLAMAEEQNIPVGFYGGSPSALTQLITVVRTRFLALNIGYAFSPPFRPLTAEEDNAVVAAINDSGIKILFIGLNSPKQDYWMAAHKDRIRCVTIGVGAAFDFIAGTKRQAPRWMMRHGLEWLFRLSTEPRRLWKRYLKHNPRFIILFGVQLLKRRLALD